MNSDENALELLYNEAVEDVRKGKLKPGDKIQEMKDYRSRHKKKEVLRLFLKILFYIY